MKYRLTSPRIFILFITLFGLTPVLFSADNEPTTEEIVVTARRAPQKISETPDNLRVITSEELTAWPVHDLSEVLSLIPLVDVQGRGALGQPSSLSIQGSDPRQTRIMVDGVLLNTQGSAFANPTLIPLGDIDRVEIIKGAGSAVWGSSLGGVVNVLTKMPPNVNSLRPTGNLTFSSGGGDIGLWQESLELGGRQGDFGYLLWQNHTTTDSDFRANSDFLNNNLSGKVTYEFSSATHLTTGYHYTHQDIGGFEFSTLGYGEHYAYISRYGTLSIMTTPTAGVDLTAALKNSNQENTLTRFVVPGNALITEVRSKDVTNGLDLGAAWQPAPAHSLTAGVDLGRDHVASDQIAAPETLHRYGLYANEAWRLNQSFTLSGGLRYDDNSAYGNQSSPFGGLVYRPLAETYLKLSVSRAFNAPPLIYKYISGNPFVIANDQLKAERGLVYEASIETKLLPRLWLKVAPYRAEVEDLVNFVQVAPWTYQAQNVDKVRRQGVEAEAKYQVTKELTTSAGWEINRIEDRRTGLLIQGNGTARTAYHLGLEGTGGPLHIALLGNYYFWNQPPASAAKDRRFIYDARISYDVTSVIKQPATAFLNIYNLLDRPNWYEQLLPNPGRRWEAGIQYRF